MECAFFLKAFFQVIFLSLAIAIFSIYIAKSVTLEPMRKKVDARNRWVGYAIKCAFCLDGWMSFAAILVYRPSLLHYLFDAKWIVFGINAFAGINFLVSWFALWGMSTYFYKIFWPFLEKYAPKMKIHWSRHS